MSEIELFFKFFVKKFNTSLVTPKTSNLFNVKTFSFMFKTRKNKTFKVKNNLF